MNIPFLFFLIIMQAAGLMAQSASTPTLSLQDVLDSVSSVNPEIKAAKSLSDSYKFKIRQSYALKPPVLEFERMNTKFGESFLKEAGDRTIGITQEIENPYKLLLRKRAAQSETIVYESVYESKKNEVIARAKTAFYQYFISCRYEAIYRETIDLLRGFSRIAENKYSVNLGTQSDAIKAQVELSRTLNTLITVEQEKETARAVLNILMDREAEAPLPEAQEPKVSSSMSEFAQFEAVALKKNPEIKAAARRLEAADSSVSVYKAGYWPDFYLGYKTRKSADPRMDGVYDVTLGLTLPVWFGGISAAVSESSSGKELAMAEYKLAKNTAALGIKESLVRAKGSLRLLQLYQTSVIPQAQEALKIAGTAYQSGKGGFIDLLDAERTLLALKLEYYRYMADYQTWLAELERLIGGNL